MEKYNEWLLSDELLPREKDILKKFSNEEIFESFYDELKFGTAGIRGVLGLGTNRFNRFIVGKTTQALADVVNADFNGDRIVVIGYDSRNYSIEFAKLCAEVLISNGITVYIFDELCPTPLVSFAIRHYKAQAGINITASHNPKEYNGFKVYMSNGAQINNEFASKITEKMSNLSPLRTYNQIGYNEGVNLGLIKVLGEETNSAFMHLAVAETKAVKSGNFTVVYTPLFGAGRKLAPEIMRKVGVTDIFTVETQMEIDGNFPNLPKGPNPEESSVYTEALEIAKDKISDLIIATDPDADRIGVLARDKNGEFIQLTGNMTGCLLTEYLIQTRQLPENPMVVKSIVTSNLIDEICSENNIECISTFTGFRFIAECIDENVHKTPIISLEESYGYLVGDFARDKDAITACGIICEMAMYYKNKGLTLVDALNELYVKYGANTEEIYNVTLPGSKGVEQILKLMQSFRDKPLSEIAGIKVKKIIYYKDGVSFDLEKFTEISMKGSDVITFELECGTNLIVRPSGTEPKIKFYMLIKDVNLSCAKEKASKIKDFCEKMFK